MFASTSYSFLVYDNQAVGATVGTVSATDADSEDTVEYSITAGNEDGKFAIDESSGEITIAGNLNAATNSTYSLTVTARDGRGGTATTTVEVSVETPS